MATTKTVIFEALEELLEDEFKQFKWHLSNRDKCIPPGKLENKNRHDVVDLIVQHYTSDARKTAVQTLRKMNLNELADRLEGKLHEVQQPEPVDGRNASMSVDDYQPIQSDWTRPLGITPSSQEFKSAILRNRNDVYIPMDKFQRKRIALLITNIRFKYSKDREGAERDEENMEWLLTALDYRVEKYTDLTGEEIDAKVKNFAARSQHRDSDSTFVVLMSHGEIIDNKDAILGVNYHHQLNPNDFFFVDNIFSYLNSVNCRALIDKPKVILIQACRGGHSGAVDVQSDSVVHIEKDFVCFKSCLPGISAWRNWSIGSYFIVYIIEVFCKWAHVDDITELFRKVTSSMAKDTRLKAYGKLMPCTDRTSIPKKLYLFPGL